MSKDTITIEQDLKDKLDYLADNKGQDLETYIQGLLGLAEAKEPNYKIVVTKVSGSGSTLSVVIPSNIKKYYDINKGDFIGWEIDKENNNIILKVI